MKLSCCHYLIIALILFSAQASASEFVPFVTGATPDSPVVMNRESINQGIRISIDFPGVLIDNITALDSEFKRLSLQGGGSIGEVGEPEIPCVTYYFEVPHEVDVQLQIHTLVETELAGQYLLHPVQDKLPDDSASSFTFHSDAYSLSTSIPEWRASIIKDSVLRGRRIIQVVVPSVTYTPDIRLLKAISSIEFSILFNGQPDEDWDTEKLRLFSPPFETLFSRILTNYEPIIQSGTGSQYTGEMTGCDYLIVTHEDFLPCLEELVRWKIQKGYRVQIAGLNDTDSMNNATVKSVIQTAYNAYPAPDYVLIVGDETKVAPYIFSHYDESVPNDYKYSLLDSEGDIFPDVFLSRIPLASHEECNNIVNKIISYDKCPEQSNYYRNVLFAGDFDDKYDPICEEELMTYETVTRIMQYYLDNQSIDRFTAMVNLQHDPYNPQSNICETYHFRTSGYPNRLPFPQDRVPDEWVALWQTEEEATNSLVSAFNTGIGLAVYDGHGLETEWIRPKFTTDHVADLEQNNKLAFVFSGACLVGKYNYHRECLIETMLKKPNSGAVGCIANAEEMGIVFGALMFQGLMTAFYPDFDSLHSGDNTEKIYRPGEAIFYSRTYSNTYHAPDRWEYLNSIHQFFGDPEMMIRTACPHNPNVVLPDMISVGMEQIRFECDEEAARVGISQLQPDGSYLYIGSGSVENGMASIDLEEPQYLETPLTVCVTGFNLNPLIAQIPLQFGTSGSIQMDKDLYSIAETAVITVSDPDMNIRQTKADFIQIELSSPVDSIPDLLLTETGDNTGVFTGTIQLVDSITGPGQLRVVSGATIQAVYHDTTCTPPVDLIAEAVIGDQPRVLFGGYLDSVVITYPDKTCGRINALMNVQNQGVVIGEAGLTMLPLDPWQLPEIIWQFNPVAGNPGYYTRNDVFSMNESLPPGLPLVFGMAGKEQNGTQHTHHWPFVPVKPDNSNNTPPGGVNWQETLIPVPGAVPNQQILSAYQESVQQLQALGAGPGAKPIIWQAGYLETDLTVGQPGTLQIGLVVTKDQRGTDIDKISVLDYLGREIFSMNEPVTYLDGFYFFFGEWELPVCPNMPTPNDWFWTMRVINVDGSRSLDWPNISKILPSEAVPVISAANFDDSCCYLSWFRDNRIEVSSFVVNWINQDDQTSGSSGALDYTQTSYLILGLDNCDTYEITITAFDLCGNELVSEPVTGKPSVEPVPQNVEIVPASISPSGFSITWSPTSNGIYALYEGYTQNPNDLTFSRFCSTNSIPQPTIQDIVKYFAVRSCISTKEIDLEYAGCFSNVVRGRKLPSGVGVIHNLKLIDLNNDGIDDLVLSTESGILQIYFGQPDDTWVLSGQVFPVPVKDFSLFDFNKDGSIDIAIAGTNAIRTYFNNGIGTMSVSETVLPSGENKVIESDDLDNKGTSDVLVGNSEGTIIKVNDETGLTDEFQYLASGDTSVLLAADLTGDTRKEVITATESGENIIWIKDAEGLYVDTNQNVYTWGTQSIKAIDINMDGCMDLIITDGYDQNVVFMNDCNGNFTLQ